MTGSNALTPYAAWYLAAFASELSGEVSPLAIGERALVAVRQGERVRVFDAACPHRGAHLGYGGRLDGDCLVCPFHGRRLPLDDAAGDYTIREHPAVLEGEALFVSLDGGPDRGLRSLFELLRPTHDIVEGFGVPVAVESEIVVENAFDPEHFAPVHGTARAPRMAPEFGKDGDLLVSTALPIAIRRRGRVGELVTTFPMPFVARAISPNLVATRLGPGELAPHYFTGTVPTADGCIARVAIAAPKNEDGSPATPEAVADLIAGSREAFREDTPVWEHLARGHVARYDERDAAVRMFREFVAGFRR